MLFARQYKYGLPHTALHPAKAKGKLGLMHESGTGLAQGHEPVLVHECRLESTGTKRMPMSARGASLAHGHAPELVLECKLESTGTKRVRMPARGLLPALKAAVLFGCLFVLLLCKPAAATAAEDGRHDELLPAVGSALVEAGQGRWDAAAADVESFAALWRTANSGTPDPALAGPAAAVDAALAGAAEALAAGGGTPATTALSTLAKSVDAYVTAASGTGGGNTSAAGLEAAAKLLPAAERTRDAARSADWKAAAEAYRAVVNGWTPAERGIRADNPAVYGLLETKMSLLRVAPQAERSAKRR